MPEMMVCAAALTVRGQRGQRRDTVSALLTEPHRVRRPARTSPLSGSVWTRNVGSSRWKRLSALEKFIAESLDLGYIDAGAAQKKSEIQSHVSQAQACDFFSTAAHGVR